MKDFLNSSKEEKKKYVDNIHLLKLNCNVDRRDALWNLRTKFMSQKIDTCFKKE